MPQIDAFTTEQLFKIMRLEDPTVSIILISADPKPLTATKYIAQGAVEYQEKPFVNFDRIRDKLDFLYPHLIARRASGALASAGMQG
jgi:CheY-like chemotaxis protein